MSAPATQTGHAPRPARPAALPGAVRGPAFARVVASEWTKLTSLRSTYLVVVTTVLVSWALTLLSANASSTDPGFVPLDSLTTSLLLAQIGPLVLGVLVGTGEFSTGTFRSTFTAVPRRVPVLGAQAVVTGAFALLVALASTGAAVLGVLPAAASRGLSLDLAGHGTPGVLAGMTAFLTGMALVGLGFGALLRSPVLAITITAGLVLVLPTVISVGSDMATDPLTVSRTGVVPTSQAVANTVVTFLPGGSATTLTGGLDAEGLEGAPDLGLGGASLVLAGWALVPLALAAARLRSRDVA
jgi:ABC-2 type transport system permease protein